ncbi:hypothetical protein ZOD2009_15646 [Haladaptatus paucihalophilus DX253]|uniref:Uncharacterized protein n=1 Tax=Haladaptatus paucihalophilus DX253 TaxID=797209 RepID=E7QWE1_HALPU|nr:hypothetical protein ZOD2009_15646 [Haladaptatus paucihalophilus DX253]
MKTIKIFTSMGAYDSYVKGNIGSDIHFSRPTSLREFL